MSSSRASMAYCTPPSVMKKLQKSPDYVAPITSQTPWCKVDDADRDETKNSTPEIAQARQVMTASGIGQHRQQVLLQRMFPSHNPEVKEPG